MKIIFAVVVSLMLCISSVTPAFADGHNEPSASAIIFDSVLVKPLGVATIAIGIGAFVATLPFTLPSRSLGVAGKKLIKEPFVFTFLRPVGEFRD